MGSAGSVGRGSIGAWEDSGEGRGPGIEEGGGVGGLERVEDVGGAAEVGRVDDVDGDEEVEAFGVEEVGGFGGVGASEGVGGVSEVAGDAGELGSVLRLRGSLCEFMARRSRDRPPRRDPCG